jgi:hypothetical protein
MAPDFGIRTKSESTVARLIRHARQPGRAAGLAVGLVQSRLRQARIERGRSRFWSTAQSLLANLERPPHPDGVAVFMNCGFLRDGAMNTLVMRRLIERGWFAASLHDDLPMPATGNHIVDRLDGMLLRDAPTRYRLAGTPANAAAGAERRHDWDIDLPGGTCRAGGFNYFPVVNGKLRRLFKAYDLDFSRPDIRRAADEVIDSADATLTICRYLHDEIAAKGTPVRILGAEHLYVPAGVFMMFCAAEDAKAGMEFVDFSGAYSHYFSAGEYLARHSYAVQNITRHNSISRHIVHRDAFDRWIAEGQDGAAALEEARGLMQQSWTGREEPAPEAKGLIERIDRHRAAGGKVACAFGHVGFDLGVPRDVGDAHSDMIDWLDDTIETLNGSETLLMIKPHPTEKRYKPNRKPNQLLEDLISAPRADNVVMMDALWFNTFEIIDKIDLGIVWRSNVALELTMSGVPAIVAGREAAYRAAVDLIYPRDRDDYHRLLNDIGGLSVDDDQGVRCALYLKYLADQTFINLPFVKEPGFREADGFRYIIPTLEWDDAELARFLADGDAEIDRVCDEIVA